MTVGVIFPTERFHLSHFPVARLRGCFSARLLLPYIRRSNSGNVKPIAKIIHLRLLGFFTHWADGGFPSLNAPLLDLHCLSYRRGIYMQISA